MNFCKDCKHCVQGVYATHIVGYQTLSRADLTIEVCLQHAVSVDVDWVTGKDHMQGRYTERGVYDERSYWACFKVRHGPECPDYEEAAK